MVREAWCAAVHGFAKSWTQLTELNSLALIEKKNLLVYDFWTLAVAPTSNWKTSEWKQGYIQGCGF